jgi:aminopeptidase
MPLPPIDEKYLLDVLSNLLDTPSPTGFTDTAVDWTEKALSAFPQLQANRTAKGALLATWQGSQAGAARALAAHLDTLGAMVKEILPSGRLRLTNLGGLNWASVECEACTIFTADGRSYRGSLMPNKASAHVHGKEAVEVTREAASMEVRLDARVLDSEETRTLGIEVGDFVAFDPRLEVVNGFVRSRYLDDKACAACMLTAVKALDDAGLTPVRTSHFFFSVFEEVGHGGSAGIPDDIDELIVVDMAAIGDGQTSDEYSVTICVKDSTGPYHHGLSQHMRKLAEEHKIPFKVDIYPYYGSDGGALLRAGADVAVALIGPGVDASHSYERTHMDALIATTQWIMAYLLG